MASCAKVSLVDVTTPINVATMNMSANASSRWGVIFDLDGVIVDTNPWHRKAILEFCRRHRDEMIEYTEETLRTRVFGIPNGAWIPALFKPGLDAERIGELTQEKEQIFRSFIRGSIRPLAGLVRLLGKLSQHGVPIAVASSAPPQNVQFLLEETRLARFFDVVLDDTSVTRGKPDPEIYLKAAAALKIAPDRCVVFEDSVAGIDAARRAGCTIVGVATTHTPDEIDSCTDDVIADFRDLEISALVGLLERRSPPASL